jgi:hypothetical protein
MFIFDNTLASSSRSTLYFIKIDCYCYYQCSHYRRKFINVIWMNRIWVKIEQWEVIILCKQKPNLSWESTSLFSMLGVLPFIIIGCHIASNHIWFSKISKNTIVFTITWFLLKKFHCFTSITSQVVNYKFLGISCKPNKFKNLNFAKSSFKL